MKGAFPSEEKGQQEKIFEKCRESGETVPEFGDGERPSENILKSEPDLVVENDLVITSPRAESAVSIAKVRAFLDILTTIIFLNFPIFAINNNFFKCVPW